MHIEDNKLRIALSNMRYGACTKSDIDFLRSRVVGKTEGRPKFTNPKLRNVSVITAWNAQKDRINDLGSARFATDTGQQLYYFYSIDKLSSDSEDRSKRKWGNSRKKVLPCQSNLDIKIKEALWDANPASSEHFAGKLGICVGLPVMIKNNIATELCITKGQEGTVFGWHSSQGPDGKEVLDTLFVKLVDPPRDIRIKGLPLNVVPLSRNRDIITCTLPNDMIISVSREQVQVLPNFAMTDYSSQGKTRKWNVVDLSNCRDHFSYYTCLSRSSTAEGTVIIQGIDESKITNGISGWLRQEFRHQELLNEITSLRYDGTLPEYIKGDFRNSLIRSYLEWKGNSYKPIDIHPSLFQHPNDPPLMPDNIKMPDPMSMDGGNKKRKLNDIDFKSEPKLKPSKRKKIQANITQSLNKIPIGFIWNNIDYSCPYDALFTILWNLWFEHPVLWTTEFLKMSGYLAKLVNGFIQYQNGVISLEQSRDDVRISLHQSNPRNFPFGPNSGSLDALSEKIMDTNHYATGQRSCSKCGYTKLGHTGTFYAAMSLTVPLAWNDNPTEMYPISSWFDKAFYYETRDKCPTCSDTRLWETSIVHSVPSLLYLTIDDSRLLFNVESVEVTMSLHGIIYGGSEHFTSRWISSSGDVWYHDGIQTKRKMISEGKIENTELNICGIDGRMAVAVIYAKG
ncbi:hypothetical protein BDZ94DRAFT_1179487 [Collybia nuda]|uniref:Uncharacterized protein n=1 Tax=Collybia nuda TaxID=64659 RepID=A0A9P5XSD2_9AGAR|nr:hypothetical protein BDZ94DRAFT_1179487 [Collybia nuda]